jgi:hypothetical protein
MSPRNWKMQATRTLVIGLLLIGANAGLHLPEQARADVVSASFYDLRVGQITDKRRDAVYIDKTAYEFHHDLMMRDDEGRVRELKDFETGAEVKFQLKQGRLALLVLILPK